MKNTLSLVLIFVLACITVDFIGAVGYMIYVDCMSYSLNSTLELLNATAFFYGLAYCLPFVAILSNVIVIFYSIRHTYNRWITFATYCVLSILIWAFIIPSGFILEEFIEKHAPEKKVSQMYLSPNYFRDTEDGTYFFKNIDENNKASGVLISNGKVTTFTNLDVFDVFPRKNSNDSLHDPLFDDTLTPKGVIKTSFYIFNMFREIAHYSYRGKGLYLLSLYSLALALTSIYGFSKFSKWRLCNVSLVLASLIVVTMMNVGVYASPVTDKIVAFYIKKEWDVLTDRKVLQLILNSAFLIINVTTGIVKAVKNPNANCEVQD